MKRIIYTFTAFLIALLSAHAAMADVKIKSKQTMAGQSYESATYIKGKRQRSESMNGMTVSLTQCDLRRSVQMNPNAKTYMVSPFAETTQSVTKSAATDKNGVVQAGGTVTTTINTKDTGERKQIFGFTARHLIITMESVSSPDSCSKTNSKMQTDGWYIDAEFALDCDYGYQNYNYNAGRNGGCKDKYEMKSVGTAKRGYPVYEKMTMFDATGKETYSMVNEVVELSKAVLEASLFDVPSDYREVQDPAQMYASMGAGDTSADKGNLAINSGENSGVSLNIKNAAKLESVNRAAVGPKKAGVVRIGLAGVKTGSVGDGIAASDLAAAVQNTLTQYLKTPNIEVVAIDATLASAIDAEARQMECDYVIAATVSHKKGGGGFGMFGQALGSAVARTGMGAYGNTAANVAGAVAAETIITATSVSSNVKSKDEVSLDLKLARIDGTQALAQVYKAKAKSNGDDIITQVVEQAAQAIATAVGG